MNAMHDVRERRLQHDLKERGPLKGRSCTDCFCFIIFFAFLAAWAGVGYFALTFGDVTALVNPTDSEGRICGIDEDVKDRPYLIFFDLTRCLSLTSVTDGCPTTQVCISNCTTENFVWELNSTILSNDIETLRNSMICKIEVNTSAATIEQLNIYVENNVCARWYMNSESIAGRCIPVGIPEIFINYTLSSTELEEVSTWIELLVQAEVIIKNVYDDFIACRLEVLAILCASIVITLFYIILVRWIATPIIVLSIIGLCAILSYTTYRLYLLYASTNSTFWLVISIIFGVTLAIIVLIVICLRNRIRLACQLIKEASKAVVSSTSTLIFPIVPWLMGIAVIVYALVTGVHLFTLKSQKFTVLLAGNCSCPENLGYENGTICSQSVFSANCSENGAACISGGCYLNSTASPWFINYMHGVNVVGCLWLLFFASAFGQMVLAGTFVTWYWTLKKSKVPFFTLTISLWRTIRYHIGTLAVGSIIITICRMIRWVLEYFDTKLKQYNNEIATGIIKCCKCCFWMLEKFLKFINKNAYIMCAIHGKSFFPSARDAFNLLIRNILRVFVLDQVTDLLLLIGKILVTCCIAWGTYWYTGRYLTVNYWLVPVVLVTVGTYFVASVFFNVYSTAVDTLFLCFLEDCERNDGTKEKPYYMSKGLMRILRKS